MGRKRLKVSILVEVILDADKETITHWDATGEMNNAVTLSIERAEEKLQKILDKHGKKFEAHIGADYGTVDVVDEDRMPARTETP